MNQILLIDKPVGITSHDVVDRIRRIFKIRRVGHAGTLDPFASGLLIVGVGDATKRLQEYVGLDKTYEATAHLGATSSTFDIEGTIYEQKMTDDMQPTRQQIEHALEQFRGGYEQKAPIFSAKKINGKKLYELARQGIATEEMRPTKKITISELTILDYDWPNLLFRLQCSSGTYVRSLADDIGRELGCGAYLTKLRRTAVGNLDIKDANTLEYWNTREKRDTYCSEVNNGIQKNTS